MAMKLYNDTDIQDIADAIRSVNGESTTYKVSEMAAAILALAGGGFDFDTATNLIPSAVAAGSYSGTRPVYNSTGYKDGYYLSNTSSSHEGGTDSACTLTGMIPYSYADFNSGKIIYVGGLDWVSTNSHSRATFVTSNGITCSPYINRNITTYFTLETYANYWTLTPISGALTETDATWIQFSLVGVGANLKVAIN